MPAIQSIVAQDSIFLNGPEAKTLECLKQRKAIGIFATTAECGMKSDPRALSRHGKSGQIAADSLYDARSRLLAEFNLR